MSRAPGPVLDRMRAGRSAGAALMGARQRSAGGAGAGRFPGGLRGVRVPRTSPRGRNMRGKWPSQP